MPHHTTELATNPDAGLLTVCRLDGSIPRASKPDGKGGMGTVSPKHLREFNGVVKVLSLPEIE